MTFEEFQASRRQVANLADAINADYWSGPRAGYVYAENLYIEIDDDGSLFLPLENNDRCGTTEQLPELERALYDFAVEAKYLEES